MIPPFVMIARDSIMLSSLLTESKPLTLKSIGILALQ